LHYKSKAYEANMAEGVEVGTVVLDLDENLRRKLVEDLSCICSVSTDIAKDMLLTHNWNIQVQF